MQKTGEEETVVATDDAQTAAASEREIARAPTIPAGPVEANRGTADTGGAGSSRVRTLGSLTSSTGASLGAPTGESTLGPTPTETLRYEEIQRTRVFLRIAIAMALVVLSSVFFLGADRTASAVVASGMVAIIATCGWLAWVIRDDEGYRLGRVLIVGFAAVYGALSGIYFFGPFSPAPVVIPFGLYFFSLSQSFRGTLAIFLTCAVGYLVLGLGATTGLIVDRGVITAGHLPLFDRIIVMALVEGIFLSTFLIGRASRRATQKALEQHDKVVRSLAQREALLNEARAELDRALQVGGVGRYTDQVIGSFRLGTVVGRGAMGDVYRAMHVGSGEPAAVKVLQAEMLRSADSIRRFVREAQIAASLRAKNVVEVYEIGGVDAPVPYIAMELLEGTDLSDHLRQHGRLSFKDTVRMVREVARGLDAAREAGIVHRDLKPGNLFHAKQDDDRRVWKILDFGVSKLLGTMQGTLTKENALVGTPEYMAPEQPLGREVSHQTDIYALGVICFRALTGTPAFSGEGLMDTVYNVVNRMPERPSTLLPTLHPDVDLVLAIAMAKSPDDRFANAGDLANALVSADKGELDAATRARGEALIGKDPWGTGVDEARA